VAPELELPICDSHHHLWHRTASRHPRIDLVDFEPGLWRQVIEVNLTAAALLIKAVLPTMMDQHSGKIINPSTV
jgi:NADP-dependent 3-hydroxy acid dehydrogenase YdfG